MPFYEYKVVPLPEKTAKVRGLKGAALFSHGLQTLMNDQAQDGWEYLRAESLPDEERKGLMGAREVVTRNVLVFRRELYFEEPAEEQAAVAEQPLTLSRTAHAAPDPAEVMAERDARADMDSIYAGAVRAADGPETTRPDPAAEGERAAVRRPLFGERKDPT